MNLKLLNALLIITSLFGYLEWGGSQHTFLFKAEGELLAKFFTDPVSALHPFTVLPLTGQLLLLISLLLRNPKPWLAFTGMALIGLLMLMVLLVGILSMNLKVAVSSLPFIILSVYGIMKYRSKKKQETEKTAAS